LTNRRETADWLVADALACASVPTGSSPAPKRRVDKPASMAATGCSVRRSTAVSVS